MSDLAQRLSQALADRYRLERQLGQGGMATVYLAQDLRHNRQVAIKVLRPELAAVLGAERFVQEIQTTAALQHPHILPLFDSGQAGGFLYYVMPYVEGETLRSKLDREKQLGIEEAVKITTEVADALDYAHRHGVIHRDIKPENILLHDGRPMVADFGIALAVSAAAGGRMTETGLSLGTPHYMSPEQATAEKEITARSDVYSLASVLYEMLTGQPPHLGGTAQQIIMKIIAEPVAGVTSLRKNVPGNVAAALTKSLEKLPADRFDSAKAFADALTDPHFAERGPPRAGADDTSARWKAAFYAASGVAVVLAGVSLFLWSTRRAAGAAGVVTQHTFEHEHILQARWGPDGRTILYSSVRGDLAPRLYIVRPDYPEPQPFGPDSAQLLSIASTGEVAILTHAQTAWSHLAFGTLARMPLTGGAPRDVLEQILEADWSPDGSQLAITRPDTIPGLRLEYPIGRTLYRGGRGGYVSDIRISPRGDRVAFFDHVALGDNRGVVKVVDTTGRVTTLTEEFFGLEGLAWERGGQSLLFAAGTGIGMLQLHRVSLHGGEGLALPTPGRVLVMDVSRDGAWLISRSEASSHLFARAPGSSVDRDLSWLNASGGPHISHDGQLLAFNDQSSQGGRLYGAMIRKTDGSPAVRLGDGVPVAISPDNRLVLATVLTTPPEWRLYPTGAGQTTLVHWELDDTRSVDFFPDSRHLFVCGSQPGKGNACYRSALDGSHLEAVTPDSSRNGLLRRDGSAVAYQRSGEWWVRLLPGGRTWRIPQWPAGGFPYDWSSDGSALRIGSRTDPHHIWELNVTSGARTPFLSQEIPAGAFAFTFADDPHSYAYWTGEEASLLFSIRGMP